MNGKDSTMYQTHICFRCECLDGWFGEQHCNLKVNSTDWKCMPGWTGDHCENGCLNR